MGVNELETDRDCVFPWSAQRGAVAERWCLTVVWFHAEPERIGQPALIAVAGCGGGRSDETGVGEVGQRHVPFFEQRPGSNEPMPAIEAPTMSRRQLRLQPVSDEFLHVRNEGERRLYRNAEEVSEGNVQVGDTLTIEDVVVLLVERRPLFLPPLAHHPAPDFPFGGPDRFGIVGESPAAWQLRDQLAAAAHCDGHVLILGPTGVGKELAARTVHGLSNRHRGELVRRSAATLTDSLADAELFGHPKNFPNVGSPDRPGLIAAANGSHLMLDEIGEASTSHQARLLRVLDEGEYQRLGESIIRSSNFRLIACTNRPPGSLKPDVLARFDFLVHVPDLNARRADVPLLFRHRLAFLASREQAITRFFRDGDPARAVIQPWLIERLVRHRYTQNARQLFHVATATLASSQQNFLELTPHVFAALAAPSGDPARRDGGGSEGEGEGAGGSEGEGAGGTPALNAVSASTSATVTRPSIEAALRATGGHLTHAAAYLGMDRHALARAMKRLGMK